MRLNLREWFLVVWCVVLMASALLAIYPGWPAIGDMLRKDAAPAWIQAIGSLLALGAGILIVVLQHRLATAAVSARERMCEVEKLESIRSVCHYCSGLMTGILIGGLGQSKQSQIAFAREMLDHVRIEVDRLIAFDGLNAKLYGDLVGVRLDIALAVVSISGNLIVDPHKIWDSLIERLNSIARALKGAAELCDALVERVVKPEELRAYLQRRAEESKLPGQASALFDFVPPDQLDPGDPGYFGWKINRERHADPNEGQ